MPLFEFQSCRASRRVLTIVSEISFCNSLLVVKSNSFPKIAVKIARLDNLPNPSLNYEIFHTFISKFFLHDGSLSSKINPPLRKFSNGYSQQQHTGEDPIPLVGQVSDRFSGEHGNEPTATTY